MKKVIIIAMLISLICVCGLSAGVCFADETSTYYYVNKGKELTMYSSAQRLGGITMQIPSTYAFKYVKEENSEFAEIEYNGCKGYALINDLHAICTPVNAKWGNNPYAYTFDANNFNTFTVDNVTAYRYENSVWTEISPTPSAFMTVNAVYGYYRDSTQQLYFLVDCHINIATGMDLAKCYIKANDFANSSANIDNIPESAGYILQTTVEKPSTPSGDINSGNNNPPSANVNGSDTQTPKNSLDRYILIAVIAVLCVVIVILIFVPTKKRQ